MPAYKHEKGQTGLYSWPSRQTASGHYATYIQYVYTTVVYLCSYKNYSSIRLCVQASRTQTFLLLFFLLISHLTHIHNLGRGHENINAAALSLYLVSYVAVRRDQNRALVLPWNILRVVESALCIENQNTRRVLQKIHRTLLLLLYAVYI